MMEFVLRTFHTRLHVPILKSNNIKTMVKETKRTMQLTLNSKFRCSVDSTKKIFSSTAVNSLVSRCHVLHNQSATGFFQQEAMNSTYTT